MRGFLGVPVRVKEAPDAFRREIVDGERVRKLPGVEGLFLGHRR